MSENEPRVWADGDLTIALSQSGKVSVFAGQQKIGCITSISVEANADNLFSKVELHFPRNVSAELELKIESYTRALVSLLPWVRVIRD